MRVVKKKRRGGEEEKWKERKAVDERHGEEGATETSRFVFFSFSRRNLHLRSIFYDPMRISLALPLFYQVMNIRRYIDFYIDLIFQN